jgi:two-component system sensor histidine kinase BaeS
VRRRLFWSLLGVAVVTGLVLTAAAAFAARRAAIEATQSEMLRAADEVAEVVAERIGPGRPAVNRLRELLAELSAGSTGELLTRMRRAAGGSGLELALITRQGELLTTSPSLRGLPVDTSRLESGRQQFISGAAGRLILLRPLARVGLAIPVIALTRDTAVVEPARLFRTFALTLLVGIALAAILARVLSNRLSADVGVLAVAAKGLADGDLSTRVGDLGDSDLATLGSAFNQMASELEESRDREREFILSVGHDLRTPLTTLGGYAEALAAGEIEEAELARVGEVMHRQTERMRRLTEDLTLLARLGNPEFALRPEAVDVAAYLEEVVASFAGQAAGSDVALDVKAEATGTCLMDPERLAQIVSNLVDNAIKHSPEKGVVTVRVGKIPSSDVEVTVGDQGPGIDEADRPHIFDRHYIGGRKQGGSGLGLAIVAGLVSRMGGSVRADSAPGTGATFTVLLPCGNGGGDSRSPAQTL